MNDEGHEQPPAAACPDERLVMLHYDALPILIEFVKKCRQSTDEAVRLGATHTLSRWDKARTPRAT